MRVAAVIVAGGRGERFGGPKQFEMIDGRTFAAIGVERSRCVAHHVVLVVPDGYDGDGEGADVVVTGGLTRSASVRAGLDFTSDADVVVIHDAARPLASEEVFHAVVNALVKGVAGAIPGLAISDTVKRVERAESTVVVDTVAREDLMTVQTPQAFVRSALTRAHDAGSDASDDAALVEALGETVVVVPGDKGNVKVTDLADLHNVRLLAGLS